MNDQQKRDIRRKVLKTIIARMDQMSNSLCADYFLTYGQDARNYAYTYFNTMTQEFLQELKHQHDTIL